MMVKMYNRMVYVDEIDITSALIASHISIGDVYHASPWSKVLAVQKEGSEFVSDTLNFEDFPIFSVHPTSTFTSYYRSFLSTTKTRRSM